MPTKAASAGFTAAAPAKKATAAAAAVTARRSQRVCVISDMTTLLKRTGVTDTLWVALRWNPNDKSVIRARHAE